MTRSRLRGERGQGPAKPHVWKGSNGLWFCREQLHWGVGSSPDGAFSSMRSRQDSHLRYRRQYRLPDHDVIPCAKPSEENAFTRGFVLALLTLLCGVLLIGASQFC